VFAHRRALRATFALSFLGLQLALVSTADLRADRIFGFRMFNESSSLSFELFRKVRRGRGERLIPIRDGAWRARSTSGESHEFHWTDRVRYSALAEPSRLRHATYGLEAQLFRLQRALDDVATHTPDDAETIQFVAVADTLKNGRDAGRVRLSSSPRALPER
jgi:hypothetical protein